MIALNIIDIKKMMHELLKGELFNSYEVREIELLTFTRFHINGILNKDYFSTDEQNELDRNYILWSEIKPTVFNIIKGSRTPKVFKIIFSLNQKNLDEFSTKIGTNDLSGLFINLLFEDNKMICTTGTALKVFTLDKSVEIQWDAYVQKLLKHHSIAVENLTA